MVATAAPAGPLLTLDQDRAGDPRITGSKAASLARARRRGLPTLPGFVLTTGAHAAFLAAGRRLPPDVLVAAEPAWHELSAAGTRALVVRSSSTVEDVAASSMAGRFRSRLGVLGWPAFVDAVADVLRSADEVAAPSDPSPLAVLVQVQLDVETGGVLFGVDPVTGEGTHVVVEAVAGGPDKLVSGQVTAERYVLSRRGRLLGIDHHPHHRWHPAPRRGRALLSARRLRELAALAAAAAKVFGGPQDIEWAFEHDGRLHLLQSRPVTAVSSPAPTRGPVLGPGPVAETFPDPLAPLEVDLWLGPLRAGVVAALTETRVVPGRALRESPVITTVGGRVACDLELFGYVPRPRGWRRLDPRPPARQLAAAWHVGRLRSVLPADAAALCDEVDRWLAGIPALRAVPDHRLVALLDESGATLARLHRGEVLAGTVLSPTPGTVADQALAALAARRAAGATDRDLVATAPVVLALVPPSVPPFPALPPVPTSGRWSPVSPQRTPGARESLRLRARWVQELTARVATELGRRLTERGRLEHADDVALLGQAELRAAVEGNAVPTDLRARREAQISDALSAPLPAEFRLTVDDQVVPAARAGARPAAGVGAGGGRGAGRVQHGSVRQPPQPGDVLVVRTLDPGLAAWLPGLAGLVAETGSTLSHLAILARENRVPTVVAMHDALRRFPPGTRVVVDGRTGEVAPLGSEEEP